MDAGIPLQAVIDADPDLRSQPIVPRINRSAYYGGKPGIEERLAAYDDKDALAFGVLRP
jgi:hypothetical protein